ncbi:MAG: LysM peptidoglycan-binding domain-containing protein, partial [Opitutales bacterium]|nr:LysM peptidoglycan-binding domain-containing protein [Opitutales bacterium]
YTVQVGDTLSSISRKVYGNSNKWREIFNANREKLSTPQSLKPGQTLIIPR